VVDKNVVDVAYATATSLGATDKVMLALFEAGLVESDFENLNHGDLDSLGYLQQRASQGWPSPRDVPTATRSFVTRALTYEKNHPNVSAGAVAQGVQISAYPARYDMRAVEAKALISEAASRSGKIVTTPVSTTPVTPVTLTADLADVGERLLVGLAGLVILSVGIYVMGKK